MWSTDGAFKPGVYPTLGCMETPAFLKTAHSILYNAHGNYPPLWGMDVQLGPCVSHAIRCSL